MNSNKIPKIRGSTLLPGIILLIFFIFPLETQGQVDGDGICQAGENSSTSPTDCGFCGDLACDPFHESAANCDDCYCGDFICDASETSSSCPEDCPGSVCGDLVCDFDETCAQDGVMCSVSAGQCRTDEECDDGDVCNGQETCETGVCTPGTSLNCDDNDACTDDSCDKTQGCLHTNNPSLEGCGGEAPPPPANGNGGDNSGGTIGGEGNNPGAESGGGGLGFASTGSGCGSSMIPISPANPMAIFVPLLSLLGLALRRTKK